MITTDSHPQSLDTAAGSAPTTPLTPELEDALAELTVATSRLAPRRTRAERDRIRDAIAYCSPELLAFIEQRVRRSDAADVLAEAMATAWRGAADIPPDAAGARRWLLAAAGHCVARAEREGLRRIRRADRMRRLLATSAG